MPNLSTYCAATCLRETGSMGVVFSMTCNAPCSPFMALSTLPVLSKLPLPVRKQSSKPFILQFLNITLEPNYGALTLTYMTEKQCTSLKASQVFIDHGKKLPPTLKEHVSTTIFAMFNPVVPLSPNDTKIKCAKMTKNQIDRVDDIQHPHRRDTTIIVKRSSSEGKLTLQDQSPNL
jgi:hypothetical protein